MKILVISHNVFSNTSNMGRTLANFFEGINHQDIAQLYFHSQVPTVKVCTNYYRITDFDLIKKRKKYIGDIFDETHIKTDLKTERVDTGHEAWVYQLGRARKPYMYIGRNVLWSIKKWKTEKLFKWIDDFNPDVIFFASGDYVFAYKIAMEIADYKNIPIITYICDDYYFMSRKSFSPFYYLNKIYYSKTLKKLFSKHKNIVTICDKLSKDYQKEFNVNVQTLMTSSTINVFSEKETNEKCVISYIGNLGYNRYMQLGEIGKAIKDITDGEVLLDVYSGERRSDVICTLTEENGIRFHGAISYDEVIKVMKNSDILLHVESMDKVNREKVRYSVSTKIADSLSCGRCLLAYGPSDVASIEYLKENDCACVVTENDDLKEKLRQLISDTELKTKYIDNALKTAAENHDIEKNVKRFYEYISGVAKQH